MPGEPGFQPWDICRDSYRRRVFAEQSKSGCRSNRMVDRSTAKPLHTDSKARQVHEMFSSIAPRYDRLNDVLSFNQHKAWRRLAVQMAAVQPGDSCLDVCTGTGPFAIDLACAVGAGGRVIGADFCAPMIRHGIERTKNHPGAPITMMVADAETLPYPDNSFDIVTVGFGVRNVTHLDRAVREMTRVVRPGGRVVILEFNRPRPCWYKPFIDFYLFHVLPRIGGLLSSRGAYTYLPESMKLFVTREELTGIMEASGLSSVQVRDLNFGTVCIHLGRKSAAILK